MKSQSDGKSRVSNAINQALKGEDITIYGTGKQTRSFQYVDDLVRDGAHDGYGRFSGSVNLGNPEDPPCWNWRKKSLK